MSVWWGLKQGLYAKYDYVRSGTATSPPPALQASDRVRRRAITLVPLRPFSSAGFPRRPAIGPTGGQDDDVADPAY